MLNKVHPSNGMCSDCIDANAPASGPDASLIPLMTITEAPLKVDHSERLQHIDLSRKVADARQWKMLGHTIIDLTRRFALPLVIMHWIGCAVFLALPFVGDQEIAATCLHLVLTLPAVVCSLFSMKTDMICILHREYEFLYTAVVNAVHWCAIGIAFGDVRAASCCVMWLAGHISLMIDANPHLHGLNLHSQLLFMSILFATFWYSVANCFPGSFSKHISINAHQISINDIVLWTTTTLPIFLAKNLFMQWSRKVQHTLIPGRAVIYCSVYQMRLVVQENPSERIRRRACANILMEPNTGTPLLRSYQALNQVNPPFTLIPIRSVTIAKPITIRQFLSLYLLGVCGIMGVVYASIVAQIQYRGSSTPNFEFVVTVGAFISTVIFCGSFACCYQLELLMSLLTNFDVWFSFTQYLLAALCLCDMMLWDRRCLNVLTWTIWYHWMLFMDALTPPVRKWLHWRKFPAFWVVLFEIYAYMAVLALLYYYDDMGLHDRVLWSVSATTNTQDSTSTSSHSSQAAKSTQLHVIRTEALLVGRLMTLILWNARLLWDVGVRADAELVFLKDRVYYYDTATTTSTTSCGCSGSLVRADTVVIPLTTPKEQRTHRIHTINT